MGCHIPISVAQSVQVSVFRALRKFIRVMGAIDALIDEFERELSRKQAQNKVK